MNSNVYNPQTIQDVLKFAFERHDKDQDLNSAEFLICATALMAIGTEYGIDVFSYYKSTSDAYHAE